MRGVGAVSEGQGGTAGACAPGGAGLRCLQAARCGELMHPGCANVGRGARAPLPDARHAAPSMPTAAAAAHPSQWSQAGWGPGPEAGPGRPARSRRQSRRGGGRRRRAWGLRDGEGRAGGGGDGAASSAGNGPHSMHSKQPRGGPIPGVHPPESARKLSSRSYSSSLAPAGPSPAPPPSPPPAPPSSTDSRPSAAAPPAAPRAGRTPASASRLAVGLGSLAGTTPSHTASWPAVRPRGSGAGGEGGAGWLRAARCRHATAAAAAAAAAGDRRRCGCTYAA